MSREETATDFWAYPSRSKGTSYGLRKDSTTMGMALSKADNADELLGNEIRRRRFFFARGNG